MSIAVIAKTLLIAVGPLLQLAVARTQNPTVPLSFVLPEHLPQGWARSLNPESGGYSPSDLVSFSPIEIAKAFDAPLLQGANTNAGAKGLVRDIGSMHVRYGAVKQDQALMTEDDSKHEIYASGTDEPCDRLVFGLADKTIRPRQGQVFSK